MCIFVYYYKLLVLPTYNTHSKYDECICGEVSRVFVHMFKKNTP